MQLRWWWLLRPGARGIHLGLSGYHWLQDFQDLGLGDSDMGKINVFWSLTLSFWLFLREIYVRQVILNCSSEILTFKVRDCSLEEEAGCEESLDGVSGKVSQTSETSDKWAERWVRQMLDFSWRRPLQNILLQTGKCNWDKTLTTKLQKVKHLSAISLKRSSHYSFVR